MVFRAEKVLPLILATGSYEPDQCNTMQHFIYKTRQRGFTLIELLVVVVIISISIGVVIVNISTNGEEELLEEEIIRLQQILRFAHEQSVIRGEEYGVRFYKTGYRFLWFDEVNNLWTDITKDKLLRSRTLPEQFELNLYIEQTPVDILESPKDDPKVKDKKLATAASNVKNINQPNKDQIKPQIYLLSSSELTPQFEVSLRIPGNDFKQSMEGLPEGKYKRVLADE
jgi:type II secretion system protein H